MFYRFILFFILNFLFLSPLFSNDILNIIDKKYITVGVNYEHKPFSFINEYGKIDGFEVEIIREIMDNLNISVKFVEVTPRNKESMLLKNMVDMIISTVSKNDFKNNKIIFSKSYLNDKQVLLVKNNFDTFGVLSLINKKIGTINSSIYLKEFLNLKSNSNIITFSTYHQLIKALHYNNIDAITADYIWAKAYEKEYENKYKVLDYNIATNYYFIAMMNQDLNNLIDKKLDEFILSNRYKVLYKKWFPIS